MLTLTGDVPDANVRTMSTGTDVQVNVGAMALRS
jgi:hypothetical protein